MNFLYAFLFLLCCIVTTGDCSEISTNDEAWNLAGPQACDQHPDCPRESHPWGTGCPYCRD